jgi:hypothetical protein
MDAGKPLTATLTYISELMELDSGLQMALQVLGMVSLGVAMRAIFVVYRRVDRALPGVWTALRPLRKMLWLKMLIGLQATVKAVLLLLVNAQADSLPCNRALHSVEECAERGLAAFVAIQSLLWMAAAFTVFGVDDDAIAADRSPPLPQPAMHAAAEAADVRMTLPDRVATERTPMAPKQRRRRLCISDKWRFLASLAAVWDIFRLIPAPQRVPNCRRTASALRLLPEPASPAAPLAAAK